MLATGQSDTRMASYLDVGEVAGSAHDQTADAAESIYSNLRRGSRNEVGE
jgi:hypothetical protein